MATLKCCRGGCEWTFLSSADLEAHQRNKHKEGASSVLVPSASKDGKCVCVSCGVERSRNQMVEHSKVCTPLPCGTSSRGRPSKRGRGSSSLDQSMERLRAAADDVIADLDASDWVASARQIRELEAAIRVRDARIEALELSLNLAAAGADVENALSRAAALVFDPASKRATILFGSPDGRVPEERFIVPPVVLLREILPDESLFNKVLSDLQMGRLKASSTIDGMQGTVSEALDRARRRASLKYHPDKMRVPGLAHVAITLIARQFDDTVAVLTRRAPATFSGPFCTYLRKVHSDFLKDKMSPWRRFWEYATTPEACEALRGAISRSSEEWISKRKLAVDKLLSGEDCVTHVPNSSFVVTYGLDKELPKGPEYPVD